jgi:putative spermidine/putrescine transport system permease protein
VNATAAGSSGGGSLMPAKSGTQKKLRAKRSSLLPLLPFFAFVGYFLVFPLFTVSKDAFLDNNGHFTFSNFTQAFHGIYAQGFLLSMRLSLASALLSAAIGAALASAIVRVGAQSRKVVVAASSVLANTGGVPLAFMFIASFGAQGLVTKALKFVGLDLYAGHFSLFSFMGLLLVYCFFQIPLMVLVFAPALENVRPEWREANDSLGGSKLDYFRHVSVPLLFPAFLSTTLLLFANAFSAYATARAMTAGTMPLVPLLIGNLVDGNVIANQTHLGHALAVVMIGVSMIVMSGYLVVLRLTRSRA